MKSAGAIVGGGGQTGAVGTQGTNGTLGSFASGGNGVGGTGGTGAVGGVGGAGGWGINASHNAITITSMGTVTGGAGGNGGYGGLGGYGGVGATGIASHTSGGDGGVGGNGGQGGNGGAGGAGVTGSNFTLTNMGTISGGAGGRGGDGGGYGYGGAGGAGKYTSSPVGTGGGVGAVGTSGAGGAGGVGVVATGNSHIVNTGTIQGGLANGGSGARANAIELSGGGNTLTITATSVIKGNVVSSSGSGSAGDTLILGGNTNQSFDAGSLGAVNSAAQYQGFGRYAKTGTSTWTLIGAQTVAGDWRIDDGTLALGANGVLNSDSGMDLNGATARLDINAATNAQTIGALSGVAGSSVVLGSQALTFGDAASTTFAGAFSGSGALTKQGSGTLTLAGDSSAFTGSTTVQAGSLLLNNAQLGGALTLASGATLAGTGSVGSLGSTMLVRSGATISPGSAGVPGMLTVQGNLTLEQGATYAVLAAPLGASSHIQVGGTATLAGSVLHVGPQNNPATDFQVGQTYTILHASQINGTFSTATSNYAYLDAALGYLQTSGTTTDVTLKLQRKSSGGGTGSNGSGQMAFAEQATSRNQGAVANAIESLPSSHPLFQHVQTLPNGTPAAVLASLTGDPHANVGGSLGGLSGVVASVSVQHGRSSLTAGMHPGAAVAQSDGPLPASAWPSSKALPAWAEVVGHWQRYDGDGNAATLKQRTTGLFLGMDQEVGTSGWRLGGSLGYTNADGKVADRASESDVNSYSAAVYGGKSFGTGVGPRINVLGGLAYTWHDIETTRRID
ncbi:MAG: autotransporter domain-containing protein, partial [Comamonas sp.]